MQFACSAKTKILPVAHVQGPVKHPEFPRRAFEPDTSQGPRRYRGRTSPADHFPESGGYSGSPVGSQFAQGHRSCG